MSLADLTAAAKKYIHPEKLAVLVVGNEPEIKPAGCSGYGNGSPHRHHHSDAEATSCGGEKAVSKPKGDGQERSSKLAVVIMAAGKGAQLKSRRPKALLEVCGKPLLSHVIGAVRGVVAPAHVFVVVGAQDEQVRQAVAAAGVQFVDQPEQRGASHAPPICPGGPQGI